ncbi:MULTISPECIES: polysaccharide deacetylase family protein [Chryseobacterium]|uniref:Peptidoglycan/xylan/chitin deacetylase (PgdA/CDA1 family) n=1 Tax=Chryseobacterium camelliae TaxID=1265445 RepID=A0ABU0TGJ7_9FLAO|nr:MULTISPECIES: polysaccharide deacetylase family protein [Chryseobacterium]MDQ1096177.1 peptidoglycan/xylan/chitin deacetylase (PgdA/CDA1 family) [Chryseobacterium camelliae]MDR6087457.1 peptidoglycan/xylan/chitin deacetylase (PgdA/CDA1 family) [Chryseobacterium sp. SORGH_AS_0909]MDR6131831.1 peptidoglycan/xylan/chitin deacetylase (PgdA/CDA1 family) [Chryseobacterium sp. SORGH_AS_1175]MDT3406022.1 peptidoglycan/xylan/chitin deacetylase (PgdA/CDA1 family) [Pseudacidovorax intermedius]
MVLLSFDIEEFDMPLEYQGEIPFDRQISVSQTGLGRILDLLKKHQVRATFFSTVVFAEHSKPLIERLLDEGHELASHTWFHSEFEEKHLKESKDRLEELFSTQVTGLRMPRMMPVSQNAVEEAGYSYNSSVNPTFLPGRYNNLKVSRTYFKEGKVTQVPASVSPNFRIPLFWLSFHNFPLTLYKKLASDTLKKDRYLNVYFHPWEFAEIKDEAYKLPGFTVKNSGLDMVNRFEDFIVWLKQNNHTFGTFREFQKQMGL